MQNYILEILRDFVHSSVILKTKRYRDKLILKVFSAKFIQSAKKLIRKITLSLRMKLTKTPDIHYFTHGWVKFYTSRKDRELHYAISMWTNHGTNLSVVEQRKVEDEKHLDYLSNFKTKTFKEDHKTYIELYAPTYSEYLKERTVKEKKD